MSKPNPTELLTCPFCGGCATVDAQFGLQWWVECDDCAASTGGMEATRAEAISAWNRRAVPALVQPEPTAERQAMRQQIIAQIDRCGELAYGAGHHFAQHGKHAPSSMMAKADADVKLIRLIEEYALAASPSASQPEPKEHHQ